MSTQPPFERPWQSASARRSDRVLALAFWFLAAITMLNLNGLARMGFGIGQAFSVFILAFGLVCFIKSRASFTVVNQLPGQLLIGSLSAFLVFGLFSTYVLGAEPGLPIASIVTKYLASIVVICSAAIFAWHAIQFAEMNLVHRMLLLLMLLGCCSVFFSAQLRDWYEVAPDASIFRATGIFGNPNGAAGFATLSFAYALATIRIRQIRLLSVLVLAVSVVATVLTFSKTAIFTLLVLVAAQPFVLRRSFRARALSLMVLGGSALAVVWILNVDARYLPLEASQVQRISEISDILSKREISATTTTNRTETWSIAVEKFWQNPVIGNGLGTLHEMREAPDNGLGQHLGAHNQYLLLIGEGGVVPGLLLLCFLASTAARAWHCRDAVIGQLSLNYLMVFSLLCLSSHNILTERYHNILLGLLIGFLSGAAYMWTRRAAPSHQS